MTPEEKSFENIRTQLEILARYNASTAGRVDQLADDLKQLTATVQRIANVQLEHVTQTREQFQELIEAQKTLTVAQKQTDERFRSLISAQEHTDQRLSALIGVVERYFSNGKKD